MKALISGYYGQGNAGDEALLMSLLQMLPSKIEPIVISADPQKTQQKYNVKSFFLLNGIETAQVEEIVNIFPDFSAYYDVLSSR